MEAKKRMTKEMKQELIGQLKQMINDLPSSCWGNASDSWGTAAAVAMLHAYNITDYINVDMGRHDLMDFLFKNAKHICYSEHWGSGVDYDCSGRCIGESLSIRKLGDSAIIIRSSSYDV